MRLAQMQETLYRIGAVLAELHRLNGWSAPKPQHCKKPLIALTEAINAAKKRGIPSYLEAGIADIMSRVTDTDMVSEIIPDMEQAPILHGILGLPGTMFRDPAEREEE